MSDYSRMSREQLLAELAKKDDLMWERSVIAGKQIDATRAELAAERERANQFETVFREAVEDRDAIAGERDATRAELAAEERRIAVMAKEIAELRARPDALRADKAEAERDTLRTELAARDALLREAGDWLSGECRDELTFSMRDALDKLLARIDAALGGGDE